MHGDGGSGYRGDVRVVIGWRDFYNIGALDIKPPEFLQHREHLGAGGSAGHRRSGSGRKCGVKAIDVEGDVAGASPT
jgi:hypothetical protein